MKKILFVLILLLLNTIVYTQQMPDYWTRYDQIKATMDTLALEYPNFIMIEELGRSDTEDYPIWGVRVSNSAHERQDRPRLLMIANIHAEEVIGMEICMKLMRDMVRRSTEMPYQRWMNELETWIVPSMNPEGLNVVMNGWDRYYRKNKKINDSTINPPFPFDQAPYGYLNGVDLNRNWDWNWVHGDSLGSTNGWELYDYYRGAYPFSEGENRAIRDLAYREKFTYAITWHSSRTGNLSEKIYTPYNFQNIRPAPDWTVNNSIGQNVAQRIITQSGIGTYSAFPATARKGDQNVWFYAETGTIMLLIECGTSNIQPTQNILNNVINQCNNGMYWMFNRATSSGFAQDQIQRSMLTVVVTDSLSGHPLEAEIIVHGRESEAVKPRMSNIEHGRYWRPLLPGNISFTVRKKGYEPKTIQSVNILASGWTSRSVQLKPLPSISISLFIKSNGTLVNNAHVSISDEVSTEEYIVQNGHIIINAYTGVRTLTIITENGVPYKQDLNLSNSITLTIDVSTASVLFHDDFLSDLSNWEIESGPWTIVDYSRHGNSFNKKFLADNWGGNGFYAAGVDAKIISSNSIIIPNQQETWLLLDQWIYTEWEHDYVSISVSTDRVEWIDLYQKAGRYDFWHYNLVDLSEFQGQSIYIRLRLLDDTTNNSAIPELVDPGWYINSIKILSGNTTDNKEIILDPLPLAISQNYPNPFNPETRIDFNISDINFKNAYIDIFNIKGQRVDRLLITHSDAKRSFVTWKADNLSSGIYFYRLRVDGRMLSPRKAVLLK